MNIIETIAIAIALLVIQYLILMLYEVEETPIRNYRNKWTFLLAYIPLGMYVLSMYNFLVFVLITMPKKIYYTFNNKF